MYHSNAVEQQHLSVSFSEREGRVFAKCDQLNIVTDAVDREQAIKDIVSLVNAHMDYAYKHGLDPINRTPKRVSRERVIEAPQVQGMELCLA